MRRREFLSRSGAAVAAALGARCGRSSGWDALRLVLGERATVLEQASARDAATLLSRATGFPVLVVGESETPGPLDVLVGTPETASEIHESDLAGVAAPGGFRTGPHSGRAAVVAGVDAEGARNGLYALLNYLGFGFFRDGETVPPLGGVPVLDVALAASPAFGLRGDMIWDNYLGPQRFCASVWGDAQWERALLFMARNGMNFLEYYPPLESVLANAFPEAVGLDEGALFTADAKHALAKRVLARGRELGIRFMYVLTYGAFPEPIRELYRNLEWRNGFLCAHQPELMELTARSWRVLIEELGTDHWYAIRHRGEEEQSYSDPCRSVTKAQGFGQAIEVLERVDPDATATVWTWGERLPDLFDELPPQVRAVHIRHGMADVFGDRGEGREQPDGPPPLGTARGWLSGQFTVFGGNETLLQTGWSDADALARDARASAGESSCEGYFQWPEWSDTSPWLSHVLARLSWSPSDFRDGASELQAYARARLGRLAKHYLAAFSPLIEDGNARFMYPPRKRLLAPYLASEEPLRVLERARAGALGMAESLDGAPVLFQRDFLDIMTWVSVRQCQALEAAAYLAHLDGEQDDAASRVEAALATWLALQALLAQVPELSIVASARAAAASGMTLSSRAEDSFWELGCNFYNGYPLVLCPEAIELVYVPQVERLGAAMREASQEGRTLILEEPGWFWHDFPAPEWADAVRRLPSEDATLFEGTMRERLREALASSGGERRTSPSERATPSGPSPIDVDAAMRVARDIVAINLPEPESLVERP